jgi:hypothetical protein
VSAFFTESSFRFDLLRVLARRLNFALVLAIDARRSRVAFCNLPETEYKADRALL